jgi:tRNA(Ile)-lysidine synthase
VDERFAFEQSVAATIERHALLRPGARVLVAVSGGPDSTALLAALCALAARGRPALTLAVGHLNHRLRASQSDRDATFVAALGRALGVACFVADATDLAAGGSGNLEARARDARYAFLERVAAAWRADAIALGHTLDDQAETVLLRLARGAGPASLAAMHPRRDDGIIRPLLEQSRQATHAYLHARGWPAVLDGSNADESIARNRVRRRVLPFLEQELGAGLTARLARVATHLRAEAHLAERTLDALLSTLDDRSELPIRTVAEVGPGAERLVHAWLARLGVRASSRQVAAVVRLAGGTSPSAIVELASRACVARRYERLTLRQSPCHAAERGDGRLHPLVAELTVPGEVSFAARWRISALVTDRLELPAVAKEPAAEPSGALRSFAIEVDAARLDTRLVVRAAAPGDRIRLRAGRRKVADVLIDSRVPRWERAQLPIIVSRGEILWVPGVAQSLLASPGTDATERVVLRADEARGREMFAGPARL